MSDASEETLSALPLTEPQVERWRDIGDGPYSSEFRDGFDYSDRDSHQARVTWESSASTLTGTLSATSLKPWFAYQLKLVAAVPIAGPAESDNLDSAERWSSWALGRAGRWWCEDCHWNLTDAEMPAHLREDHTVHGYLLFDWFVTDGEGNAEHPFALDSSLHVLWRVDQREAGRRDSAARWYEVIRDERVYPASVAGEVDRYGIYAEWEPDRPRLGEARLPAGNYAVRLNLTEETFHANLDEERMLPGGGFWALVLDADLEFEVRPISHASCSGCLPGPHEGMGGLWRRLKTFGQG